MKKSGKKIEKNWELWIGVIIGIIIILGIMIGIGNYSKEISSNEIEKTGYENKEFTNEEIIEFAKSEIKKKLRYPDTVIFQKNEILGKEDNKFVVSIYSISQDKNYEEGRMKFVLGIKNNKGILETYQIATNEQTCNNDVAEEFEMLVKEKKYDEIYENLFANVLKNKLSKTDFINYNLDLTDSKVTAEPNVDSNNYLKYITTTIKDKDGQYWIIIIKNGMIYSFSKVLL